jgi:PAS domain S-box-containing protein
MIEVVARTQLISGSVLVVAACAETDALLEEPALARAGLELQRAADPDEAIARVERGEVPDVVLLAPRLADPVRVAQRLHSLDRDGAVVVLARSGGAEELRYALEVAPFLGGDVAMVEAADDLSLVDALAAAAARTQGRREQSAGRKTRPEPPPPLSARYLGTLLDSVPLGLVTLDADGGVIGWNKRAGEMLQVPEVEALGRSFAELFEPEAEHLEALIASLGTAGLDDVGQVYERAGRWFEVTGARFATRSGDGGSILILQDVTKRHTAERELELQQALMAAQADSSLVGIAVVTLDGTLERMNRRWTQIWGVDAEQIRGDRPAATRMMLDQVVDPGEFTAGRDRLAATGGGEYSDEVELKDGRVIERYATHVRNDAGEVVGRIWFHTDITAHRREEDALRFLADATNLLSSSLDYETTLERVADLAVPRIADHCSIDTKGKSSDGAETVVESGEGRSAMSVPIKVRDRVFGTMNFARTAPGGGYDADDVKLAEELARRVAIAIDNSRMHAELRETARTLQESLLPPHLPAARGLDLAARFRPAGVGMQVGGDFYDIFETAPDQWAIVVGDVCGKGAEAAALTALTRYTARAAAMYEKEPSGVLSVLNQALLRQRGDYRFTTVVFCLLDLSGERPSLRVACGGHPQPLLLRPDGSTEIVGATGPLLGVMADAAFEDQQADLEPGDVLVLYTDGLTDALAPQQMLDEDALMKALAGCGGLNAGEVCQRLEEFALAGCVDRAPRDDVALVVAKLE